MINIIIEANHCHFLGNAGDAFLSYSSTKILSNIKRINMNTLKQIFKTIICVIFFFVGVIGVQAQSGEETFNKTCKACHTIGAGKLVGPDLNGVASRRSEAWLMKWTKSSQSLINSGDADAKAVFEANNKIPMPDQILSDADINGVVEYIKSKSSVGEVSASANVAKGTLQSSVKSSDNASAEEIALGQMLFEKGNFTNGGPACISCHNIASDRIIPGGLLAKDLTAVHSRMGGDAGLSGILNAPPFPAMTQAYKNKAITEKEIFAITAFLNKVEKENGMQPIEATSPLLKWGFCGLAFWIIAVFFIWMNRKKHMVKQKIYDRQTDTY